MGEHLVTNLVFALLDASEAVSQGTNTLVLTMSKEIRSKDQLQPPTPQ